MSNCSLTRNSICAQNDLHATKLFSATSSDDVFGAWNSSTITITGASKGTAGLIDVMRWKQIGKTVFVEYAYGHSTAGAASTGNLQYALPVQMKAGASPVGSVRIISTSGTYIGIIRGFPSFVDFQIQTDASGSETITSGSVANMDEAVFILAGSLTYEAA